MISTASDFVREIASLTFENVFNPYCMKCDVFDRDDAPRRRRKNLETILDAALESGVESIWVGRDLGYRGGRRTGLALTDEAHLGDHASMFDVNALAKATTGPIVAERTATVVWNMLNAVDRPIFLWNVFPLHPHEPGEPQSNRSHSRSERLAARPFLMWLIEAFKPEHVVAIGRDAQLALADLGVEATGVRHPSYGGQRQFEEELSSLYGLRPVRSPQASLF